MQESNSTAQNKLGELFVEFGAKGLGGLMGGLNGISAQFLLTKNAAEQAIKPIWGMAKRVSGSVVEFNKLNSVTGLSVSHLMEMKKWAELNDIDFSEYIGNLKNLQMSMREAIINRNPQILQGFAMLGISPQELDFQNPEKVLNKIQQKIKDLDPVTRTMALNFVNLSEEMVYAMTRANKSVDKSLNLTKDQIRNTNEVNSAVKELGVTWGAVGEHLIGNWENLDNIILNVNDKIKGFIEFLDSNSEKKITIVADFISDIGKNLKHFMKGDRTKEGKSAFELALTGKGEEKKDLNFIGKLGYYGIRSGLYSGLAVERALGGKTTMEDVEKFYQQKFDKRRTSNITPQAIQQNVSKPIQNVAHLGNKEYKQTNEINITVNAQNDELREPSFWETSVTRQIINNLSDYNQSYQTRREA